MVGKDLVPALHSIYSYKPIKEIWDKILNTPQSLDPEFTGISKKIVNIGIMQLLSTPTNPFFIQNRLTIEMERKIKFILESVNSKVFIFSSMLIYILKISFGFTSNIYTPQNRKIVCMILYVISSLHFILQMRCYFLI